MYLRSFTLPDGRYFHMLQNSEDDTRTIVDEDEKPYLLIDADLRVKRPNGEHVGRLSYAPNDRWQIAYFGTYHDLGPLNGHHWRALEAAEIEAAKILIPLLDKE